jgi:hypothetical protein
MEACIVFYASSYFMNICLKIDFLTFLFIFLPLFFFSFTINSLVYGFFYEVLCFNFKLSQSFVFVREVIMKDVNHTTITQTCTH